MAPSVQSSVSVLPMGRQEVDSEALAQLVRDTIALADAQAWREWWWCDPDFADWPLGERAVVEALDRWAGQGRKLCLLACNYQTLRTHHARFVTWRVRWNHCIEARACPGAEQADFPSGMWMPNAFWMRMDPAHHHVVFCGDKPRQRMEWQQMLGEWWAKATPAFPASTLGL